MEFFTKVDIAPFAQKIDSNSRIMLIGSCFSTAIGTMFQSHGFNTCINPFGVLFNPASIANACERLANPRPFEASDVIDISLNHTKANAYASEQRGLYIKVNSSALEQKGLNIGGCSNVLGQMGAGSKFCSFSHHSSFARGSVQEFLENANSKLERAAEFFKQADTLIVTLGTAYVFRHVARNMIVSNCHKIVPQEFSRELLSIEQSVECLERILKAAKGKHVIFTVSPVRHLADGAHGNQLSKSTLLHAINELKKRTTRTSASKSEQQETTGGTKTTQDKIEELSPVENMIDYFPAFEIMMDELRDYRFYAEDMVHPSEVAVKYIFECFCNAAVDAQCKPQMIAAYKKHLFMQHARSKQEADAAQM